MTTIKDRIEKFNFEYKKKFPNTMMLVVSENEQHHKDIEIEKEVLEFWNNKLIQSIKEVQEETRKEIETNKWCEITSRLENNYYIGLSRHSNDVYISIRNKGDGTKGSKGGVALQYKIDLEQTLSEISEDMDKRNTTTFNNLSITNKEIKK